MAKVAIIQPEVSEAIDQLARELREALAKAEQTLSMAPDGVRNVAYRVHAGEAIGKRDALVTLDAYLEISPEAAAALDFFDLHQPQLIG